ncbi:hypothetical protein FOA52_007194 [Chlamydomonas sp. UWO 241]|nr:hypothetical protein FOA52_007194 [Chlamydomonas sp. UWO 241]
MGGATKTRAGGRAGGVGITALCCVCVLADAIGASAQAVSGGLGANLGIPVKANALPPNGVSPPPLAPPSPPPFQGGSGLTTGQIIGICFGAALGLPILICLCMFGLAKCTRSPVKHKQKWLGGGEPSDIPVSKHYASAIGPSGDDIELGTRSFGHGDYGDDNHMEGIAMAVADERAATRMPHLRGWLDNLDSNPSPDSAQPPPNKFKALINSALAELGAGKGHGLEGVAFSQLPPSVTGSPAPSSFAGSSRLLLNFKMGRSDEDALGDDNILGGLKAAEGGALSTLRHAQKSQKRKGTGMTFVGIPQDSVAAAALNASLNGAAGARECLLFPPGGTPRKDRNSQPLAMGSPVRALPTSTALPGSPVQVAPDYTSGRQYSPAPARGFKPDPPGPSVFGTAAAQSAAVGGQGFGFGGGGVGRGGGGGRGFGCGGAGFSFPVGPESPGPDLRSMGSFPVGPESPGPDLRSMGRWM